MLRMIVAVACGIALFFIVVSLVRAGDVEWHTGLVTAYSTRENLTGCTSPGVCHTACGSLLNDRLFTVAANPRWGLGCGARIKFCFLDKCKIATVTDRTASYFDFEFTYALALATGQTNRTWDSPRRVRWQRAYGKG
jgi:hypothetical protein